MLKLVNVFIHKYLLSTYYVPSIVPGTGDTVVNQTKSLPLEEEVNKSVKWMTCQRGGAVNLVAVVRP